MHRPTVAFTLAATLAVGILTGLAPTAAATPTFTTPIVIGASNQDNQYDSFARDNVVVIAHTVDTSNIMVVEISLDGGSTWATRSTGVAGSSVAGQIRVAASDDGQNIVVLSCANSANGNNVKTTYTTNGGTSWTTSLIPLTGTANGSSIGTCDIHQEGGLFVAAFIDCTATVCSTSGTFRYRAVTSPTGSTWTATGTANFDSGTISGGTFNIDGANFFSFAITMQSTTAWNIFYTRVGSCSSATVCVTSLNNAKTTDGGSTWTTHDVNDAFTPYTDWGRKVSASDDGTVLSWLGGVFVRDAFFEHTWYDTLIQNPSGLYLNPSFAKPFSCGDANTGRIALVYQGISGDDRVSLGDGLRNDVALTSTAVTGQTSASALPYTAFLVDDDIHVVYGDSTNGRTIITATTGDFCAQSVPGSYSAIFCSARGNTDFGYDYVEDTTLEVDDSGSLSDTDQIQRPAYVLADPDTNEKAYLGKSWSPGSRIVSSYFTIEAQRDNEESQFRSAFTIGSAGPPSSSSKGNGDTTEDFVAYIEAAFVEVDNDWNVQIRHVNAPEGQSTRTTIGPSFVGDSPNTPTHYNFTVNTIQNKAFVRHNVNGVETDMFPGGVSLPSYWEDQYMVNHWFIGQGTNTLIPERHWHTNLDSRVGDITSTCLFSGDVLAQTPNGDPGSIPPTVEQLNNVTLHSTSPTSTSSASGSTCQEGSILCVNSSTVPSGFTVSGFNALLGVLLMAGVGGGFYFIDTKSRYSMLFASVGAGIGFFLAFFLGLFPLWLVLVGVLVAAAVLVFRFRGMAGA